MSVDARNRRVNQPINVGPRVKDLARVARNVSALSIDKETASLDLLETFGQIKSLHAREIPPAVLSSALPKLPDLEELSIFGTRMDSLEPLTDLPLTHLRLIWAHKIEDIAPIGTLNRLETLVVGDMKRVRDFSPVARCDHLTALHIESGMWTDQKVDSLAFLRSMPQLNEFSAHYLIVADGDLTPICSLKNLQWLSLPTKYPVREYARMSVCLPETECAEFASHVTYKVGTLAGEGEKPGFVYATSGVLVGKPSTAFDCPSDKANKLIAKREALFERWREHYRRVDNPEKDRTETLD